MTSGTIAVLLASVVVVAATALLIAATSALLWSIKRLEPLQTMRIKLAEVVAMVDNLESQVINLRTRKANRRSQESRAAKQEEEDVDPALAGLTEEERSLFM